jgi:hypothetical protein
VETLPNFETEFFTYMHHEGVCKHQFRAIHNFKKALKENEAIIHCDFSENYSSKYHEEVQSFHFGGSRKQFTIHTVMVYHRKNVYSEVHGKAICTLSESNEHSAVSAWAHLRPVFEYLNKECPNLQTLHFQSDGPTAQYRNRTIFYLVVKALKVILPTVKTVSWNYSAPGHGKGAPDGLGGTLKRSADDLVARGVDIASFPNFVASLQACIRNIELHVIDEAEIQSVRDLIPSNLPSFQGTMKVYQFICSEEEPNMLRMKSLSCLTCLKCSKFEIGKLEYENGGEVINENELPEPLAEAVPIPEDTPAGCRTAEEPVVPPSELKNSIISQAPPGLIDDSIFLPDTYVLVKFKSVSKKSAHYQYVCRIIQPDDTCDADELAVQGLRSSGPANNTFVVRETDLCTVRKQEIINVLPSPKQEKVRRKAVFVFPYSIDVKEK